MTFAYYDPANIEFGVCRGPLSSGECAIIPVDNNVKALLQEMVIQTRSALSGDAGELRLPIYEPAQQYGADSRVMLPLYDDIGGVVAGLYNREGLPTDALALDEPQAVSAYFCIVHDRADRKLVAIRRASQFKAVLKSRLIHLIDETLKAVEDDVFKLDGEFDVLIANETIYIRSITAFEQLAEVDEQVMAAAADNTRKLQERVPFIWFSGLAPYVAGHKRAARLVASLCSRGDLAETSLTNLRRECRRNGIAVEIVDGQICPMEKSEIAFLQMLDRRRYTLSLVPGRWEQYEAGSRKGVGVRQREQVAPVVAPSRRRRNGHG